MTRLTESDISPISNTLVQYNEHLKMATGGYGLFEIGCRCWGLKAEDIRQRIKEYSIQVIPSTAGLGIISNFSESVATILRFLGFTAGVSRESDVSGLAQTFSSTAHALFMADDNAFISYDFSSRKLVDNNVATGKVFATTLALMTQTGSNNRKKFLVIGCGPVGFSAAEHLYVMGRELTLFDTNRELCLKAKRQLSEKKGGPIHIAATLKEGLNNNPYVVDATPAAKLISDRQLNQDAKIVLPGVPPGISDETLALLAHNAIHDKLELGVTAMAMGLFV